MIKNLLTLLALISVSVSVQSCSFSTWWEDERPEPVQVPSEAERAALREAVFLKDITRFTAEVKKAGESYFSRDGEALVFQAVVEGDNPFYQIYLTPSAVYAPQLISTGTGKTTCAWIAPSDREVLFASTHLDPFVGRKQIEELERLASGKQGRYEWSFDEHFDLFVRDLRTWKLTRLTDAVGYDAEGSYSPDGKSILFASNREYYTSPAAQADFPSPEAAMDLYLMKADGSEVERLTTAIGYDGGPFFNRDASMITWRRFTPEGRSAEIFVMDLDSRKEEQITSLGAISWAPYFHPSGEYLIFSSNAGGGHDFELYIVDVLGKKQPLQITSSQGFDGLPVFSPDGNTLAFASKRGSEDGTQVYFATWNHEAALSALDL